jgi:site-specific DNA recombinase
MRVAIYARVSTDRQCREQTIDGQLTLLQQWVEEQQHMLNQEHIFIDESYSGARLDRPGLDALRDAAASRAFDLVAVLCPDRLARKYAYQVVLLEELRRAGCQTVFLQRPISDDPNDQLLLQIQGAIAEYERTILSERFRRGKLQKARAGHWVGGKAPYGYRYLPKQDGVPGHLVVDETEAEFVRMLYRWLTEEQMTIRQILKRLNEGPWTPRSGSSAWSPSAVHHILSDPVYTGTAYANRYRFVPPKKPRKPARPGASENTCRQPRPQEEWIPVPVSAIIDQRTCDLAQAQLSRNAALSFRNNTKYNYLLRCLLTCGTCGLAMFGTTYRATAHNPERRYYKCHGKDPVLAAREERCPQSAARAGELEAAVWDHVSALLRDPECLLEQFEQFAHEAIVGNEREQAVQQRDEAHLKRLQRQEQRLIDAYQADVISLEELSERRQLLAQQRQALILQQEQRAHVRLQTARAQQVLQDVRSFCAQVESRLDNATFDEKQRILQLVIERVIVGEDTLEIRHVIPLRRGPQQPGEPVPDSVELRSDGPLHAQCAGSYSPAQQSDGGRRRTHHLCAT